MELGDFHPATGRADAEGNLCFREPRVFWLESQVEFSTDVSF